MRNMRRFILVLILGYLSLEIACLTANDGDDVDFAIAGYLPDYRIRSYLYPQINDKKKVPRKPPMTDLIVFSLQPHPRGFFSCCLEQDHYELVEQFVNSTVLSPFSPSPSVRVWVTLGGGGRTEAFPEICASNRLRQRLVGSVITLRYVVVKGRNTTTWCYFLHSPHLLFDCHSCAFNSSQYSFIEGIDLDFFQPRTMEELENYVLFLSEAITQWHHHGLKVSMTLHPGLAKYIPNNIFELLDRIHFMAYDMIQGGGYHASVSKVIAAVEELLRHKVPSHKVLLGIPAYSRHENNPGQVKMFAEIYDEIEKDASHDEQKKIFSDLNSWHGYTWESPVRIREKIHLAKKMKLGGVFFWELGQDKITKEQPGGILLEAAAAEMEDDSKNMGTVEL